MQRLSEKQNCTGCTACASICPKKCIEMQVDESGFSYPVIYDTNACVQCGLCESICPVLHKKEINEDLPKAYAAYSKDESLRKESSSGGIFSELAKEIIKSGGIVYGAAYNADFEVVHITVDNINDLGKLRGAKYAQSDLNNSFVDVKNFLQQGRQVLFSGTPCQVAGLKAFLRKDYANLICIDFVCHGVPSPMAWKEYVKYRSNLDNNGHFPVEINLRDKETGWSRYKYSNVFDYGNGNKHSCLSSQSLFMKLFVGDYISRPSCENCHFKGYNRGSDFTIGDFWGIWDIDSSMDDDKGTSVVLIHSEKGKKLFDKVRLQVVAKEVTLEEASLQNPSMLLCSKSKANRDEVLEMIRMGRIGECEQLFVEQRVTFAQRIKNRLCRWINN